MSVWTIEPRDPLIFRDGKPFNPTPGARAKSLPFPNPSTLAGAVRTRAGQEQNGQFIGNPKELLEKVDIRGPVLTNLQNPETCYFPAPADCLVIAVENDKEKAKRLWARPVEVETGEVSNLPDDLKFVSVCPVEKSKPLTGAPRFWKWEELQKWLLAPENQQTEIALEELGISGLTSESRMHVKIAPGAQTAEEGMLFQTSGLEFALLGEEEKKSKNLQNLQEFALLLETDANLSAGVDFLGGERRMVNWKEGGKLPTCPPEIRAAILKQKSCRLVLATPALFENGYLPQLAGMPAQVVAAAVPRGTAVSGWDYTVKFKDGQKASRRLAPAGSVYFLKLEGEPEAIGKFVDTVWMHNISDEEQDRRDGFGLALLGAWNANEPVDLEVK
jgi:CRISPR-associated protein Cmr3